MAEKEVVPAFLNDFRNHHADWASGIFFGNFF
jgi:hypothetical protein